MTSHNIPAAGKQAPAPKAAPASDLQIVREKEALAKERQHFALGRQNYILLAIGMLVVVAGFILMSGKGSTEELYNPAIFDARHIKVAPVVCFLGYLFMIYAVLHAPRRKQTPKDTPQA